ncbi:MAG: hypothetical protein IPL87_02640 [Candidatus Moraniibacteriota bacterium]|nr:MAG: hypothetical protein IPL87_02640 [Candidatus Moranbacteria bacterium]
MKKYLSPRGQVSDIWLARAIPFLQLLEEERDALLYAPTFPECHPVFTDKSASMELYIVCQWKAKERRKRSNSV